LLDPALDQLSERHFAAIAAAIESRAGIKLPRAKRTMVEGRLRRRVRALGLDSLRDYGAHLFDAGGLAQEMPELIECVTTNKTDFFREPSHFDFMRDRAVQELGKWQGSALPSLKVWSAAASTGAEAYTAAMVLQDLVDRGRIRRFSVLGTDISVEVLGEAQRAIYPREFVEPVPADLRRRFLMSSRDPASATVRIVPELRGRVAFHQLNLMDAAYPYDCDVDIIFCRNVLIYFDKQVQRGVVTRLCGHLREGGFLILGHSESMAASGVDGLRQAGPTIYQRIDKA
jgi:chemotaxis protein methyltransferase CheR